MIWLGKRYTAAHLRWLTGANTERGGLDRGLRLFGVSVGWLFLGVAHSTREARSESSQPEATPPSATETVDPRREAKSASASEAKVSSDTQAEGRR